MVASFLHFVFFALLSLAVSTAADSTGTGDECRQPAESEHEEQSLLAVRRFGPPPHPTTTRTTTPDPDPKPFCYNYSYTFATKILSPSGGRITNILVRHVVVDMETATLPKLEGQGVVEEDFLLVFNFQNGQKQTEGTGADEYYLLFEAQNLTEANLKESPEWTVTGLWPNAAYVSLQLQYTFPDGSTKDESQDLLPDVAALAQPPVVGDGKINRQQLVFARDFGTARGLGPTPTEVHEAKNPFDAGNPTVLAWPGQVKCAAQSGRKVPGTTSAAAIAKVPNVPTSVQCMDSGTDIYRLSVDTTSAMRLPADEKGCSSNYIISPGAAAGQALQQPTLPVYNFQYGYIRFRIPAFQNNFEELVQRGIKNETNLGGYDLGYFSVSSQFVGASPDLPFTVNSLMLAAQAAGSLDSTEAVILFAPPEVVKTMPREVDTAPPIVEIPGLKRRAYVMYAPNFLFLFRYMGSSPLFEGNPSKGVCKESLAEQLKFPVTCAHQKQYKPMITRSEGVNSVEELISSISSES